MKRSGTHTYESLTLCRLARIKTISTLPLKNVVFLFIVNKLLSRMDFSWNVFILTKITAVVFGKIISLLR